MVKIGKEKMAEDQIEKKAAIYSSTTLTFGTLVEFAGGILGGPTMPNLCHGQSNGHWASAEFAGGILRGPSSNQGLVIAIMNCSSIHDLYVFPPPPQRLLRESNCMTITVVQHCLC